MAIPIGVEKCNFYIEPGNTYLFSKFFFSVPGEGQFVLWTPLDTGTQTKYRVEDVIIECQEAISTHVGSPEPPPHVEVVEWRVEVSLVP